MSTTVRNPENGDVRVVPDVLKQRYVDRGFEVMPDAAPRKLKGAALDQALKDADLPTGGTADEKRERLHAHMTKPTE